MKTRVYTNPLPVSLGDRSYQIIIQSKILPQIGRVLHDFGLSGRVGMVTNPVVNALYGPVVQRALKQAGFSPIPIVIPDGEQAKSLSWLSKILDTLVTRRFERGDVVLALGGGVVGDVAGFAASIYLRGVPFVQVPTTLVAQVDSSVGGKTGVNHHLGKNLIGTFYQPHVVVIDPQALQTLPKREWIAGLAEVIKYGMIADAKFFAFLERHVEGMRAQEEEIIPTIIRRCCEIKAEVVGRDERESGYRRILNYGHTVGHALETWGKYTTWIHGEAVGIGMVQEAALAHFLGMCDKALVERQCELIQDVGLPIAMPHINFMDLWKAMEYDKKVVKGQIHCVVPTRIGEVQVVPLVREQVRQWFAASQSSRVKRLKPVFPTGTSARLIKKK